MYLGGENASQIYFLKVSLSSFVFRASGVEFTVLMVKLQSR